MEMAIGTRVTQSMLSTNMLRNLNSSYSKMSKLQDQITSGKKITRASDDPVIAVKGMGYRTQLGKVEQFIRNTGEVNSWYDTTDMSLGQAGDALNRVKELVVQAANDTNTADDRAKIKAEIDQIREQLRDLGNTKVAGKSIFTGTNTEKMLYTDVQYYDPKSIQKHYDSLASAPPVGAISAQEDFLNKITPSATNTQENIASYLGSITTPNPITMISDRVLNTEFVDGEGKPVNPIKDLQTTDLTISTTVANAPNAPGAIKGETVTTTTLPNGQKQTITTSVGDTETTTTTVLSQAVGTGSNKEKAAITAGDGQVKIEVFDGVQLTANFPGADIFGRLDVLMGKVSEALDPANNPNHETIQKMLGGIVDTTGKDKDDDLSIIQGSLLTARAEIGARQNRLELIEHRLDQHEINVTKQMSENEDTDYALAITQMATTESIHQAALSVGAKIIQQTLVDFIR